MNAIAPLLAAPWNELISLLIGAVFLLIWVLNQISDAKKNPAAGEPEQLAGEPPLAQGNVAEPPPGDPLRAQIDEFLRRAGQPEKAQGGAQRIQRAGRPPRPVAPGGDEIIVLLDDELAEPPQRAPLSEPLRRSGASSETVGARAHEQPGPRALRPRKPRSPQRVEPPQQSVAEHAAERSAETTRSFQQEVADLGQRVIQADQEFDVQLHKKFDRELGSLAARHAARVHEQQPPPPASSPASQIAAMLSSPDGVRQAIVINEILRRPDDRW